LTSGAISRRSRFGAACPSYNDTFCVMAQHGAHAHFVPSVEHEVISTFLLHKDDSQKRHIPCKPNGRPFGINGLYRTQFFTKEKRDETDHFIGVFTARGNGVSLPNG
jgi:hypothetical protein